MIAGAGDAVVSRTRYARAGKPNLKRKEQADIYFDVSSDERELLESSTMRKRGVQQQQEEEAEVSRAILEVKSFIDAIETSKKPFLTAAQKC
jgi:hypothetical protein